MKEYTCNYALIRFLPHRETGEFINIGIVLACAETGYLDFLLEKRRFARVTHFFPELSLPVYREGLHSLEAECNRWQETAQRLRRPRHEMMRHIFGELTRASESVFHFSPVRTVLANDPATKLQELFTHYIRRRFVTHEAYGEESLRRSIAQSLRRWGVERIFHESRIGTADYSVKFPFVATRAEDDRTLFYEVKQSIEIVEEPTAIVPAAYKAIKPLNLDRQEPAEITQHGDDWIARVRRLQKINKMPEQLLFVVKEPATTGRTQHAAAEICHELQQQGALTIKVGDEMGLRRFARLD